MKKSALLGLALALTLLPAGCGQDAAAPSAEIPSFSYAEVQDVTCRYDNEADMWDVSFFTAGVLGGCQDVYLSGSGVTCLIVYGE